MICELTNRINKYRERITNGDCKYIAHNEVTILDFLGAIFCGVVDIIAYPFLYWKFKCSRNK